MKPRFRTLLAACLLSMLCLLTVVLMSAGAAPAIDLVPISTYNSSSGPVSAGTEIVSFDPGSKRAFSTNGAGLRIDVTDLSNPSNPVALPSIDLAPYGSDVQSVAVHNGVVAAALKPLGPGATQRPGVVAFFNKDGAFIRQAQVGALPDMVTFTPDGKYALTANEGEPACDENQAPADANNPEGSVSIITVSNGSVKTADFKVFNFLRNTLIKNGVRLNWPGATVAQDLEPEYITTDGLNAWVTLQENNAIAQVNVIGGVVVRILPLGSKRHDRTGQGLDPSDRDSATNQKAIAIVKRPVDGLYMPDGIALLKSGVFGGYLLTANEGDARDYGCFGDDGRVADFVAPDEGLKLDPADYSGALVGDGPAGIGRLTISATDGDLDGDGLIDRVKALGARSFSVWTSAGKLVFRQRRPAREADRTAFRDVRLQQRRRSQQPPFEQLGYQKR